MKYKLFSLLFLFGSFIFAQELLPKDQEITINEFISGSLLVPSSVEEPPLMIIIAGSGPTDTTRMGEKRRSLRLSGSSGK